jgi:hypothetical protein
VLARNNRWAIEVALPSNALAAEYDLRLLARSLHEAINARALCGTNEWPHLGRLIARWPDLDRLHLLDECVNEALVDLWPSDDAAGCGAVLPRIPEACSTHRARNKVNIGIIKHKYGCLSTELKVKSLHR